MSLSALLPSDRDVSMQVMDSLPWPYAYLPRRGDRAGMPRTDRARRSIRSLSRNGLCAGG
jgi:hypothetical protein